MPATQPSTKALEKVKQTATVVFDLLASGTHLKSEYHFDIVAMAIRNGIYDFCPRIQTGRISAKAAEALEKGQIKRRQLCHEHFITRKDTTDAVINNFDYYWHNGYSNNFIIDRMSSVLTKGSQVNLVLSKENMDLVKYQKMKLAPEECYRMAGITLIQDNKEPERTYVYNNKVYNTQIEIARDLSISATTVQRRLKKGLIAVVERKAA